MTDESRTITGTSTEVLEHEAVSLAAEIAAATCRWLLVIAELDRRESWGSWWGCTSMAHWLSWRCSLSEGTARDHVRVARALRSLPVLTAAFASGELSYSKVRAVVRVATPDSEADLVDLARTATAAQLEKIIRASVVAMSDPARIDELRELYTSCDGDGMGTVKARVRIDELAIIDRAIAAATVSAETPIASRRVTAMVKICESYLANGDAQRNPPARNNAVVHVDIDPTGVVKAETEAGVPVHPATAERLLCDASVQGMLGDLGHPIGIGRASQSIPRRLRRALKKRSGGQCEWLGCEERRYVEGHHVWHWARGGPTELWNLVNLCWHHHHLVHDGGWRLAHDGRGGVRCFRPDGTELHDPVPIEIGPIQRTIDDERIVPLWCGERFDLSACVDAVLYAGSRSSA